MDHAHPAAAPAALLFVALAGLLALAYRFTFSAARRLAIVPSEYAEAPSIIAKR